MFVTLPKLVLLCEKLDIFEILLQICIIIFVVFEYFRCLVWYAYSAWFLHLPAYIQSSRVMAHDRLLEASSILTCINELNLPLFDEVKYLLLHVNLRYIYTFRVTRINPGLIQYFYLACKLFIEIFRRPPELQSVYMHM